MLAYPGQSSILHDFMRSLRHARVIRSAARQKIRLTSRPTLSLLRFLPLDFVAPFSSVDVVTDGVVAG